MFTDAELQDAFTLTQTEGQHTNGHLVRYKLVIHAVPVSEATDLMVPRCMKGGRPVPGHSWLMSRRIITSTNRCVRDLNDRILSRFSAQSNISLSADKMEPGEELSLSRVSVEILNNQQINGMPPHELTIMIGMPYNLMRNLDVPRGLCNGTVVIPVSYSSHVVRVICPNNKHIGSRVTVSIPRICFIPNADDSPFLFRRVQFPMVPAMACTVNKVQGQTMDMAAVYLPRPVRGHGQLYVALTRVKDPACIRVLVTNGEHGASNSTTNVVFPAVISAILGPQVRDVPLSDARQDKPQHSPRKRKPPAVLPSQGHPTARAAETPVAIEAPDRMPLRQISSLMMRKMHVRESGGSVPARGYCGYIVAAWLLKTTMTSTIDQLISLDIDALEAEQDQGRRYPSNGRCMGYTTTAETKDILKSVKFEWDAAAQVRQAPAERELAEGLWCPLNLFAWVVCLTKRPLLLIMDNSGDGNARVDMYTHNPHKLPHTRQDHQSHHYTAALDPRDIQTNGRNIGVDVVHFNGCHFEIYVPHRPGVFASAAALLPQPSAAAPTKIQLQYYQRYSDLGGFTCGHCTSSNIHSLSSTLCKPNKKNAQNTVQEKRVSCKNCNGLSILCPSCSMFVKAKGFRVHIRKCKLDAALAAADHPAADIGSDELNFDALVFGDCTDNILNLEFLDDADLWPVSSSMDISIPIGVVSQ